MLQLIEKNRKEIILITIFVFFALGFNIYRVQSDGLLYYSFLEYILHLPGSESFPDGFYNPGFQQSGSAFFNIPFYLTAYAIENLFSIHLDFNGITLRQISINLASNFYMILSLVLVVRILRRMNFKYIIIPVVSILFSTSAFMAAVVFSSFPHAVDIFVNTLFIYLFLKNEEEHPAKAFWLGIVCVLSILVRYFNFVLMIPVIVYYLNKKEYHKLKYLLIGFIAIFWIIPSVFYTFNGHALNLFDDRRITNINTFITVTSYIASIYPVYILKYLVHPLRGLFVWSPVTILSALGLLVLPKAKEKLGYLFIGTWFLFLILYGLIPYWHCGWSFSNRYLVNMFPIYIIGLSGFLEKYGRKMTLLVVILTVYSIILFLNWHLCIFHPEFGTPWDIVKVWIKGESDTFMDGKVNIKTFLHRLWEWCRYKYIFRGLK